MQNNFLASPLVESYLAPPDPHEAERIRPFGVLTLVLALITLLLEACGLWALVNGHIGLGLAVFFHLMLCGALCLAYVFTVVLPADRLFMVLLILTTATLGAAGAAGVVLCLLLALWYSSVSTPFSEWFSTIFPSVVMTSAERLDEDLRTGRDEAAKRYDVEPFLDVLRYGNDDQKRRAISKITSNFTPGFAPALQRALADESNMIRVQAATAISIIENRFQQRMMKLSRLYQQHRKEPEVILALANFHDDYSFTGILDEEREEENRKRAVELYVEYLEKRPEDGVTRTRYGRLLLRMGQTDKAIDAFREALANQRTPTRVSWLAEGYFRAQRFAELRILSREIAQYPEILEKMEDSVRASLLSWSGMQSEQESA